MKVGVISRGSPDYLIDIVTDGLLRLLGRSSLSIDYNIRLTPGGKGAYQHLCQGLNGPEPFDIYEAEILVASSRSTWAAQRWKSKTKNSKVAILDGEDLATIYSPAVYVSKIYFKREYVHYTQYPSNVRPLPFAAIPEETPQMNPLEHKVFYTWHSTHPFRKEVELALRAIGFPPAPKQDKGDYNRSLKASLVGIAVRGNGWDTYRFWEIPYFGACLLSQRPGIVIPQEFVDGHEAIYWDTVTDLRTKLKMLLDDPDRATKIREAGHKAAMERHLSIHRAKTVLEALA